MIDREKILVENELYKILEYAKDGNEEKIIIEEYEGQKIDDIKRYNYWRIL